MKQTKLEARITERRKAVEEFLLWVVDTNNGYIMLNGTVATNEDIEQYFTQTEENKNV